MPTLVLVMRKGLTWHADHVATLRHLGFDLHLLTEVGGSSLGGRFASTTMLPAGEDPDEVSKRAVDLARTVAATTVLTFAETDIVIASTANEKLGHTWARPEADTIARDKHRQRALLAAHGIPSVGFAAVPSVAAGLAASARFTFPLIVKPTLAAFSRGVALVRDRHELERELTRIERLAGSRSGNYFTGRERDLALLEEFLPGDEVTLDGVVVFGRFHVAGVSNKMPMPGPYFEEDYYTLPFRSPARERELVAIAEAITSALGVEHCLFNVELRQDAAGAFRVVEFSTRMSGGQNYQNLREVHGIDVVRLHVKALHGDGPAAAWSGETPRLLPRRATCIKYAYRTGMVLRNAAGPVAGSEFFLSYIPLANPGDRLARAPDAYDVAGSLSVAASYERPGDIDRIEDIARALDSRLDVLVVPLAGQGPRRKNPYSSHREKTRVHPGGPVCSALAARLQSAPERRGGAT